MDKIKTISINSLNGGYEEKQIFNDFSVSFLKGTFTALAGPNGSGKTTLLKFLIKELKATGGTVCVIGDDVSFLKQKELAKRISFVGQNTSVFYEFTVRQLVSMGLYSHSESSIEDVNKAMALTGITDLSEKLVTRISGGELQMAMLSRAICQNTDCIVLDEPINNLDPKHQIFLLSMLKKLSENGKTIVCVLHDLNAILKWCDDCILLKDGKVFASGKTDSVITEENIKEVYDVDCTISQADGHSLLTYHCSL